MSGGRNAIIRAERERYLRKYLDYVYDALDSKQMLNRLIREIEKTGGGRQRTEGVKLLKRILVRLDDRVDETWKEAGIYLEAK